MIHKLAAFWHFNLKWLIQNWSQGHRDSTKPRVHTLRVELKNEAERKDGHRLNRMLQKHTTKNLLQGRENTCWCWGKPWMVSTTGERNVRAKALAMWSICTWNNNIHVANLSEIRRTSKEQVVHRKRFQGTRCAQEIIITIKYLMIRNLTRYLCRTELVLWRYFNVLSSFAEHPGSLSFVSSSLTSPSRISKALLQKVITESETILYFWEKETSKKRLEQWVLHILDYNNIHAKVDPQLPKQFCLDCCSNVNQTERFLQVDIDCRHSVRDKFWPADMQGFPHVTWSSCYFLPTVKICQKNSQLCFSP